ncbi:MAG: hypothetical protein QFX35_02445 [Candidatus Verstraetearchaeota archaeon]|nr:hypothetical protein [Candidatus Verstraetearchaeota archaeon]
MIKKFFRRTPPLKDTLDEVIRGLWEQRRKLEIIDAKLKGRKAELFRQCSSAMEKKSSERAKIYANEIAEIKRIQDKVSNGILLLEQLSLRMETLREIGSTFSQLEPTLEAVRQVSEQLSEVIPEVSGELMHIGSCLNAVMSEIRIPLPEELSAIVDSVENEEILDEASNYLRGRLIEKLPEPPKDTPIPNVTSPGGEGFPKQVVVRRINKANGRDKEKILLEYLEKNDGMLDVEDCALKCEMKEDELAKTMESLSKKGLIKIMTASEAIANDGN